MIPNPRILIVVFAAYVGLTVAESVAKAPEAREDVIAILGTGDMGDSFGPRLAGLGYQLSATCGVDDDGRRRATRRT